MSSSSSVISAAISNQPSIPSRGFFISEIIILNYGLWIWIFCIFLIFYISLLNTLHSSFNFLAIWNTIIITNLISLLIIIFMLVLVCFWLLNFSPNLRLYFPGLSKSFLLSQKFDKKRCWTFLLWHKYDWALFWDAIKLLENCFYFWDLLGSDRAVFSLGLIIAVLASLDSQLHHLKSVSQGLS